MTGFRLTTKVQVSGWRFLLRRVEHALVRRDTRMFDDPIQFYSRAVTAGIVIAVLICLGAALLAFFKPLGKRGGESLLVDRSTNQLFVVLPGSGQLRPVYNLTSARLILGDDAKPVPVTSAELDGMPRGQTLGIPGAPYATPVSTSADSQWSLCDTVINPESVSPAVNMAVLIMPLVLDASVGPLAPQQGMLVAHEHRDWLVTSDGRHAIDLADRAVTSSLGIAVTTRSIPISDGLFNALPEGGAWRLPDIPGGGAPNTLGLPSELVIGSVFNTVTHSGTEHFVVLPDGVARINDTTAAALRATDSYGLVAPPAIEPSAVARINEQVYHSPLPNQPMRILSRQDAPTLCWAWERQGADHGAKTTVIAGRHLPLPISALGTGIEQIGNEATVYLSTGQYLRVQSPNPRVGEHLYYVDPQGVRYGLPDAPTAAQLGLNSPINAPWPVVRLLVDGPVLSKGAALVEHDTLPADPNSRKVSDGRSGDR
ncbi:MAG: type VII secretion protein EccB [Mycolicibacterium sp.]|uniref:type VII secretion protein EccB n=1 Tax=Mycolicibacterium sp. TaxID=2320850 RepID=UPI003D133175